METLKGTNLKVFNAIAATGAEGITAKALAEATGLKPNEAGKVAGVLVGEKRIKRDMKDKKLVYTVTEQPKAAAKADAGKQETEAGKTATAPKAKAAKKSAPKSEAEAEKATGIKAGYLVEFTPFRETKPVKAIVLFAMWSVWQSRYYIRAVAVHGKSETPADKAIWKACFAKDGKTSIIKVLEKRKPVEGFMPKEKPSKAIQAAGKKDGSRTHAAKKEPAKATKKAATAKGKGKGKGKAKAKAAK